MKIAVSILSTNLEEIKKTLGKIKNADYLHLDVMDGKFVEQKTFDYKFINGLKTSLKKTIHLMIKNPEIYVDEYIKTKPNLIIFHVEASNDPSRLIDYIKKQNIRVGISLSPGTSIDQILPFAGKADHILIMTVVPGKSGQEFMNTELDKVRLLSRLFPDKEIAVDGGINEKTAILSYKAGANVLVAGSFIFKGTPKKRIEILRKTNF